MASRLSNDLLNGPATSRRAPASERAFQRRWSQSHCVGLCADEDLERLVEAERVASRIHARDGLRAAARGPAGRPPRACRRRCGDPSARTSGTPVRAASSAGPEIAAGDFAQEGRASHAESRSGAWSMSMATLRPRPSARAAAARTPLAVEQLDAPRRPLALPESVEPLARSAAWWRRRAAGATPTRMPTRSQLPVCAVATTTPRPADERGLERAGSPSASARTNASGARGRPDHPQELEERRAERRVHRARDRWRVGDAGAPHRRLDVRAPDAEDRSDREPPTSAPTTRSQRQGNSATARATRTSGIPRSTKPALRACVGVASAAAAKTSSSATR